MVGEPLRGTSGGQISEMALLAKLIMKMGPDIDQISRISGQYKETIRYRYKEKIIGRGFVVHARLNYDRLGLQRVVMRVTLGGDYAPHAKELFVAMNKLCYVVAFNQLLPDGSYMLHANVPRAHAEEFVDLMKGLRGLGIFETLDVYNFEWYRNVPMRTEYFDFDHGVWDFDWTKTVEPAKDDNPGPFGPVGFDRMDLLILKELQADATRSLSEIRDAIMATNGIDINYKTLAWHWAKHVQEKRLIEGYSLRWMGTSYDSASDRTNQRSHRYIVIPVFVHGLSDEERVWVIGEMNRVPFLWCEAAGADYHAQLAFPVEMVNEAFSFLRTALERFGTRATCSVFDQSNALTFTLCYQLYDDAKREWKFNGPETLSVFRDLVMKIGESAGR